MIFRKEINRNSALDRCKGSLLGLAIGDALGTTLEFRSPGSFAPITDMTGGGVFGLPAGKWTDDTSMALCLAESLINRNGFDAFDQLSNYWKWYSQGYNSSTGTCFDIGNATRNALHFYESTGQPYCGDDNRSAAGNGSIMRLAPIPIFYYSRPTALLKYSALSSKTTHASPQCIDACIYMSAIIAGAIKGMSKEEILSEQLLANIYPSVSITLDSTIQEILNGSFKIKQPPQIHGSGYVVKTLEAALWAFYTTHDFKSGALQVVNLGDDADTTGAVYGQIAGAYYGWKEIPEEWIEKLYRAADIEKMAACLYNQGKQTE